MQATKQPLSLIVGGPKQFTIPVFQRDYSWTRDQCSQMWNDIMRTGSVNAGEHFMGSFVYVVEDAASTFMNLVVIDGQQRLTTLTLLLIALRDHIQEINWKGSGDDSPTRDKIDAYYIRNTHESDGKIYKLALRRHDDATLRALVVGEDMSEVSNPSELIIDNYKHFRKLLNKPTVTPDKVYRGLGRLQIVDVRLDHTDNPQLVFESLNSTGVRLSQSDLIRNYLLMGLPSNEQDRLYEDYWRKLESDFRRVGTEPDTFLRDYIALKKKSTTQARADEIYSEFKEFWPLSNAEATGKLLADLVKFARYYVSFLRPSLNQDNDKALIDAMMDVRPSGYGNALAPLIMRLHDRYDGGSLSQSDFVQALKLIKSYLIRRAVLGLQTRNYWSVFTRMALSIDDKVPFESFQVALARQSHKYRFPADEEFIKAIQENDLYGLRLCFHILECLENTGQSEPSPTKDYSIEHIMPQSIEDVPEWKQMLGDDWANVQTTWLHRLGNLTLTAYNNNSKLSNKPFEEKKNIKGGFKDSAVRLNRYVREQEQWTVSEMQTRGRLLSNRAVEIWPYHDADPKLIQEEKVRDLQNRASQKDWEDLEMSGPAHFWVRTVKEAFGDIGSFIEVIENKSVCFYNYSGDFFAELLPMSSYVRLLVPLDFDEVDDPEGLAQDVKAWKFLPNVTHRYCGVFIDIWDRQNIQPATEIVHQVFNMEAD